jgi:hypothetical protein
MIHPMRNTHLICSEPYLDKPSQTSQHAAVLIQGDIISTRPFKRSQLLENVTAQNSYLLDQSHVNCVLIPCPGLCSLIVDLTKYRLLANRSCPVVVSDSDSSLVDSFFKSRNVKESQGDNHRIGQYSLAGGQAVHWQLCPLSGELPQANLRHSKSSPEQNHLLEPPHAASSYE